MRTQSNDYRGQLCEIIGREHENLLNILRHYLLRAGLASRETATSQAHDLLNEVVVEAMSHAERLANVDAPFAWLLGIGANLIKRRQATQSRNHFREPLIRDLYQGVQDGMSDAELFDQISQVTRDPTFDIETNEQVQWWLAHVSQSDREIIELAILHELNGEELAEQLAISTGAARVRLHRALRRLRAALTTSLGELNHE